MPKMIQSIMRNIAIDKGLSVQQLRADMVVAIHTAVLSDNQAARTYFRSVFGEKEPTPEEFIMRLAEEVTKESLCGCTAAVQYLQ